MLSGNYLIGFKITCDKCKRYTPTVVFQQIRKTMRDLGWYKIDLTPHRNQDLDICNICAKKHTLDHLGRM